MASLRIGNSVKSIGDYAFRDCTSLTDLAIPDSVTSIGYEAFGDCTSLTNVTIGNGVSSIGTAAFYYCTNLTSITIGNRVTGIGAHAFNGCSSLKGVYFKGNAPGVGLDVFAGDDVATVYYLPGTTGWTNPYAGLPAVLWNPSISTFDASFGVRTNCFGFTITGTTNIPLVVEASTNLRSGAWTPLQSSTLTNGSIYFSDAEWTNYPSRFYHLRWP